MFFKPWSAIVSWTGFSGPPWQVLAEPSILPCHLLLCRACIENRCAAERSRNPNAARTGSRWGSNRFKQQVFNFFQRLFCVFFVSRGPPHSSLLAHLLFSLPSHSSLGRRAKDRMRVVGALLTGCALTAPWPQIIHCSSCGPVRSRSRCIIDPERKLNIELSSECKNSSLLRK